ncbi:hypothetical protein N7492_001498 [Penicillium capsulatum]|uniref:Uncharacterized protein n=1 Tax=Penicillium capsulatum TaxID=69766 RepID=A0A9W9ITX5_9EURO|nr:hypothetical protein N7492_001498 [Penicillium capsulatum]KAJ6129449.1 hypothetical protein N7512_002229 [Penicillium capsulatum]
MDLARLEQPAILSQCLRCSSSLAVLENEWAKLSNAYAVATGWLSANFHRISISSEHKVIPQSSDLTLLRQRVIQELSCKLCQQKLGVLCPLDNGPNILWKMSKVSFREIVTMRTADPIFNDSTLDRLLSPPPKDPMRRDRSSIQDGALVPVGTSASDSLDPIMQQQMRHQGRSIDQISNSVNHLQDTMTDLKHSFTSLRIELNDSSRYGGDHNTTSGVDFDMIATVLRELKSKSEEIEKLKLEIEALKLKNRFIEDRKPDHLGYSLSVGAPLPEERSPGLLQAGRKRAWPDAFPSEHTVADSMAEEDMIDDLSLEDLPVLPVRGPSSHPRHVHSGPVPENPSVQTPQFRIEMKPEAQHSAARNPSSSANYAKSQPTKRQRLAESTESPSNLESSSGKKASARMKKSGGQSTKSRTSQTSGTAQPRTEEAVEPNPPVQVAVTDTSSGDNNNRRGRLRRSTTSQFRSTANNDGQTDAGDADPSGKEPAHGDTNGEANASKNGGAPSKGNNAVPSNGANGVHEPKASAEEKRKAKFAARDAMTRMAMQREEAMETDEAR